MNWKRILIILVPSVLIFLGIFITGLFSIEKVKPEKIETSKSMILLTREDCEDCNLQREIFQKFRSESKINGLSFKEVNVNSAEFFDFLDFNHVSAFPSILILTEKGLPLYEYDGLHTYEDLASAVSGTVVSENNVKLENQEGIKGENGELTDEEGVVENSEGDVID